MPLMQRRTFLIGTIASAGGLALGYRAWSGSFEARAAALTARDGESLLGGWIKIGTDGLVTVYIPHVDMGQGTHTALAMMAAEELDADWSRVRAERAPVDRAFANRFLAEGWSMQGRGVPSFLDGAVDTAFAEAARLYDLQITGGSTAIRFTGQIGMRLVGAAARSMLVRAAAHRWGVASDALAAAEGVVSHAATGRSARYGELAAEAVHFSVPATPPLKTRKDFKIIGTSPPRFDIPAKVQGAPGYAIDVRLPDMLYAAVKAAPVHGARLVAVNPAPALAMAGVERVVPLHRAVAVVAQSWWQASRALAALEPEFSDGGGAAAVSSSALFAVQDSALAAGQGKSVLSIGDAAGALQRALPARVIEATYRVPFLHHAAMEPVNATAQYKDGRLTVWSGEQNPLGSRAKLAKLARLSVDDVTLVPSPLGGSFGRRLDAVGYLDQVVRIAIDVAPRPVKMIWSREEDFAHGTYRPALTASLRAALGPDGRPVAWSQLHVDNPAVGDSNKAFAIPYLVPNQSIRSVAVPSHVHVGSWRSVAHSQHGFYAECFIDELAHAAGQDPFAYRRDLLPAGSRHRRVLETAAAKAGWGEALPRGVGRGIALVESFGTIVAHVIEASLGPDAPAGALPRVHRVTAAVDCGEVCHPDTAAAQVEGAIVMGLSAAIGEEITIDAGAVAQRSFPDYPLLTLAQTPRIEVHFLTSDGPWGGLGEPGLPPVAPALANALFAATGRRLRTLPLGAAARRVAAGFSR